MEQAQRMISLYHTGFLVCAVLVVFFLILSVFLFFRFNVWGVLKQKTGFAAHRSIRQTNEINQRSGRLQRRTPTATQKLPDDGRRAQGARPLAAAAKQKDLEDTAVRKNISLEKKPRQRAQAVPPEDTAKADATTLLKGPQPEDVQIWVAAQNPAPRTADTPQYMPEAEAPVLPVMEAEETTLLAGAETEVLQPENNEKSFKINKKLVLTHTSETG